jgi:hypothetical protein
MRTRLNESDINRIVKKVINEEVSREQMIEIIDDVANRLREHGMKYYRELNSLNFNYPTEKYKRLAPPKRGDFELPKGVKVSRSTFPDEI